MPFVSKSQLRTCYSKKARGKGTSSVWNCDEFLSKTPSVCCLPEKKGYPVTLKGASTKHTSEFVKNKRRCMKNGERIVGKVQTGPRGGKYFEIKEKDSKGIVCIVKVYLPKK